MGFVELERYIEAYKDYKIDSDSYLYKINREYLISAANENSKVLNLIEVMVDLDYEAEFIFETLGGGYFTA
ncbi:MAG: hypothetical protein ACOCZ5_03045 [bacterium]